jgi:hypothetical protein
VVYRALDREQNSVVTLKALKALNGTALLNFKRGFRLLQDIRHPGLARHPHHRRRARSAARLWYLCCNRRWRRGLGDTPGYVAPERVAGAQVGPAADMYGVGVLIYPGAGGTSLPGPSCADTRRRLGGRAAPCSAALRAGGKFRRRWRGFATRTSPIRTACPPCSPRVCRSNRR